MNGHLSEHQIRSYSERKLTSTELLAAGRHIAECSECRDKALNAFGSFLQMDSMWNDLEQAADEEPAHVSYEQLEGFVRDSIDKTGREIVQSHLEICAECAAAERDLRRIQTEMPVRGKVIWWRTVVYASTIAACLILISFVALIPLRNRVTALDAQVRNLTIERNDLQQRTISSGANVANLQKQLAALQQGKVKLQVNEGNSQIVVDSKGRIGIVQSLEPEQQKLIAMVLSNQQLQIPASVSDLIGSKGQLMGQGEKESFSLISPVGTTVEEERPSFRWQSLKGAASYSASVFDSNFNLIEKSPPLQTTEWKLSKSLQRGKVYAWQVIATRGNDVFKSPMPPAPPAMFSVLDAKQFSQLQSARGGISSHLILGIINAQFGLLDGAEKEFRSAIGSGTSSDLPNHFLAQIQTLREKK